VAEIHITGQKMLKTINAEFQENFPYLCLYFYTLENWNKTKLGGRWPTLEASKRLSEVRTKKETAGEFSIHGRTLVKNIEQNFYKIYGICCQVGWNEKDGNRYYTSGRYDDMSLTQLNKEFEARGCIKNPK
jgi:hypothetical protein